MFRKKNRFDNCLKYRSACANFAEPDFSSIQVRKSVKLSVKTVFLANLKRAVSNLKLKIDF
jgi:hypothetical protein